MTKVNYAKAIRLKCLECSGDSWQEVALCPADDCALWPFRFGCKPGSKTYQKRIRGLESLRKAKGNEK